MFDPLREPLVPDLPANWINTPESRAHWRPIINAAQEKRDVEDRKIKRLQEEKEAKERMAIIVAKVCMIIEERGKRIGGAIDPKHTIKEIEERLLK